MITKSQTDWLNTFSNQVKLTLSYVGPEPWANEFKETYSEAMKELVNDIRRTLDSDNEKRASKLLGLYFNKKELDQHRGVRRDIIQYEMLNDL